VLAVMLGAHAAENTNPPVPDVLVYNDGDRVQGRLISRDGDMLVFQSVRFGELRVPISEASIVMAGASVTPLPGAPATEPSPAIADSPHKLTQALRGFFGPWSGRFLGSAQVVSDASERTNFMAEASLNRTWPKDEVNLMNRYDYSETDEVDTVTIFRGNGVWRHTLPRRLFTVYRPSYEWNRASTLDEIRTDYVLLQQEIGFGVKVVDRDEWKLRVGVAENFFNTWDLVTDTNRAARVESVFLEADLKFPWRIVVTERAVYYYSFDTGGDGWEHQFEVTKKLTDTLSLGLRHEVRYNDPDVRTTDYSLLRLLLGFDF
jgi:hypothetical protein